MDQIILFGDSLTEQSSEQLNGFAFQPALQATYMRRLDVLNRGYSGYNTTKALRILPHIILPAQPSAPRIRLFSLFLGANDARLPHTPDVPQHVSPEQFRTNLRAILDFPALKSHEPKVVLVTPPPVEERLCRAGDRARGINAVMRRAVVTAAYAQVVREVGEERGLPVVDLWRAVMVKAGWKEGDGWADSERLIGSEEMEQNGFLVKCLRDGLHFSGEGYRVYYDEWLATVRKAYPELEAGKLPHVFPEWSDEQAWETFSGPKRIP